MPKTVLCRRPLKAQMVLSYERDTHKMRTSRQTSVWLAGVHLSDKKKKKWKEKFFILSTGPHRRAVAISIGFCIIINNIISFFGLFTHIYIYIFYLVYNT